MEIMESAEIIPSAERNQLTEWPPSVSKEQLPLIKGKLFVDYDQHSCLKDRFTGDQVKR